MEAPEPWGQRLGRGEAVSLGVSLGGGAGAEGDPREPGRRGEPPLGEAWVDLLEADPPALGDPPPAKESGSRTHSDVDAMSNDVILQYLHCKYLAVSKFQDPAAKEFLKARAREVDAFSCWLQEKEDLQAQKSQEVAQLKAENQRLQQELQEAKRSQRTGSLPFTLPWSRTDFHIQVHVAGETGGCEKQFLKKVSDHLSDHRINLKVESYREGSSHVLLVFCPVATLMGSDMDNVLKVLGSEPKAVLVILHPISKGWHYFGVTELQAQHPAVVRTVHAGYTIQEGFYTCPVSEKAVATVAKVLEDHCKGAKGDPANPGAPSKSWNL